MTKWRVFGEALARAILNAVAARFRAAAAGACNSNRRSPTTDAAFIEREMHVAEWCFPISRRPHETASRASPIVLPSILRNCYDLAPLSAFGARAAIVKTARAKGEFCFAGIPLFG